MPTPPSASRYRPAILVLTGAAAAYAAYLVYKTLREPPSNGLQRSNAVRRRVRRRNSLPTREAAAGIGGIPSLGEYNLLGVRIELNPHSLPLETGLRSMFIEASPDANPEAIEAAIVEVYDVFLDRLLHLLFPRRGPNPQEVNAIQEWLRGRIPDTSAVTRAAERYMDNFDVGLHPPADGAESVAGTDLSWGSDDLTEGDTMDRHGQILQRTLYHIAEDRAKQEGVIHRGITCNGCDEKPIRGTRWHCANCVDFDLCSNCEATNCHYKTHIFYKIRVPAPYLGLPKQEPLYPGKPQMMSPSIDTALKKRLVSETKMEAEEIEALWDQFTCLAGTEWTQDTPDKSGVGWALDRRAFNHAFVPRYNSFIAAPNLIYDRIFAYYDTDNNGLIGFDEWIKGIDGMHTSDVEVKSRIVFNGYDVDGDGYISRRDILRIFRAFYAIEKEATRNYVAELTEDLSVRNALETIRSSQPLGSAFPPPPHSVGILNHHPGSRTRQKGHNDDDASPVLDENNLDVADREEILRATDLQNVLPGVMSPTEQDRIVTERWARRQFYVDDEEGLTGPEDSEPPDTPAGANVDETNRQEHSNSIGSETGRPRWSRSSSRVRFQDDVDVETRSNASTSSRPFGERWGGYEIPEPEKDLGREVLYQITQQGFNELLNPLFQAKEDMAMDAQATRSDRKKLADTIHVITEELPTRRTALHAIIQVGIFRFSKCIVETFCKHLNDGDRLGPLRNFFDVKGELISRGEARKRLASVYATVEDIVIQSVKVADNIDPTNMEMWNMDLCKLQLEHEILNDVLDCVSRLGWIAPPDSDKSSRLAENSLQVPPMYRDPTMPQFRPNSLADMASESFHLNEPAPAFDGSESTDETSLLDVDDFGLYERYGDPEHLVLDPRGPFFTIAAPPQIMPAILEEQNEESQKEPDQPPLVPALDSADIPSLEEPAPTISSSSTSSPPNQDEQKEQAPVINWRIYTHTPAIHILFIRSDNGIETIQFKSKAVTYMTNPYQPETDPLKNLMRHLRQYALASDYEPLYHLMLASLDGVDEEISDRKGSGLIDFEEFAEHMRQGKLRFLESWMEWLDGHGTSAI